jgi:hypothetical protein
MVDSDTPVTWSCRLREHQEADCRALERKGREWRILSLHVHQPKARDSQRGPARTCAAVGTCDNSNTSLGSTYGQLCQHEEYMRVLTSGLASDKAYQ